MKTLITLTKRNVKLFFKDKGMFFTSLITPAILLVLYATFLSNVYKDSFMSGMPQGVVISESLINGLVGGQLVSSLLAVSCITVAFCSNFLMVQDRVNGTIKDLTISPLKPTTLSVSYFIATFISTAIICFTATIICLGYLAITGWYLTFGDTLLILLDVLILTLFGTALSSVVNFFLTSQGQLSAVGTIVSAGYGFICGAYMPISSFSPALQKVVGFLPGTYGTSLLRNHTLRGVLGEMGSQGIPTSALEGVKESLDCNLYFFETQVQTSAMFIILCASFIVLLGLFVVFNIIKNKKKN
ncbi:MAG: ABC transporter permease [Clostridia bacterium]|nr:ABC transporter permease [Clostridia bacterium]